MAAGPLLKQLTIYFPEETLRAGQNNFEFIKAAMKTAAGNASCQADSFKNQSSFYKSNLK